MNASKTASSSSCCAPRHLVDDPGAVRDTARSGAAPRTPGCCCGTTCGCGPDCQCPPAGSAD